MNSRVPFSASEFGARRKYLRNENAKFGKELQLVAEMPDMPGVDKGISPFKAYRSKDYLVQLYHVPGHPDMVRLSVNRTMITRGGDWEDGIPWEEIQRIKNGLGFGDRDAVEVYPPVGDEVNVANMRHIWVLSDRLPFPWRRQRGEQS